MLQKDNNYIIKCCDFFNVQSIKPSHFRQFGLRWNSSARFQGYLLL